MKTWTTRLIATEIHESEITETELGLKTSRQQHSEAWAQKTWPSPSRAALLLGNRSNLGGCQTGEREMSCDLAPPFSKKRDHLWPRSDLQSVPATDIPAMKSRVCIHCSDVLSKDVERELDGIREVKVI
jgi:hypothetical protein